LKLKRFPNIYKDQFFLLIGTVITTVCLTFIGTDHSLSEILSDRIIFKKLSLNGLTVLIGWLGVRQIIFFFDYRLPWKVKNQQRRWLTQLPITLIFITSIFLLQLYSRTLFIPEWKLFPKTVWSVDFPLSLLFGLSFNFIYYHWWMQNQRQMVEKATIEQQQSTNIISRGSQSISVKKGRKTILIPNDKIAYAFRVEEFNYLVAQNGEKYLLDVSLNALEKELSTMNFFRLNRQLLAHRNAIKAFQILPNRHLQVELQPELNSNLLINKNKAASFKKWINRKA